MAVFTTEDQQSELAAGPGGEEAPVVHTQWHLFALENNLRFMHSLATPLLLLQNLKLPMWPKSARSAWSQAISRTNTSI